MASMFNKFIKRTTAGILAMTVVLGTNAAVCSENLKADGNSLVANAAESITAVFFDKETGTLTLSGKITKDDIQSAVANSKDMILKVVAAKGTVFTADSNYLFSDFKNCTEFDLSNVDTSNAVYMNGLFSGCESATKIDVSKFNTSNVKSFMCMFMGCKSLETIDVSNFDTSNVTTLEKFFYDCSSLEKIDLKNFNTKNVTRIDGIFGNCKKLKSVDVSSFDTSNVEKMYNIFDGCSSIEEIDISNFDCSKVNDFEYNFHNCTSLKKINLKGVNPKKATMVMGNFENCKSIEEIDFSDFECNTVSVRGFFSGCENLKKVNISKWDFTKLNEYKEDYDSKWAGTYGPVVTELFADSDNLEEITIGGGNITEDMHLHNTKYGWYNIKAETKPLSGDGDYAVIQNEGVNTYCCIPKSDAPAPVEETLYGDFDRNGKVDDEDVVSMNRYLADPKEKPSEQALKNGDAYRPGSGITKDDAAAIKYYLADIIPFLPVEELPVIRGDANCDGVVDEDDAQATIDDYVATSTNKDHTLSEHGLKNADVDGNNKVNSMDATYILKYIQSGSWFDEGFTETTEPAATTTTTSTTTASDTTSTTTKTHAQFTYSTTTSTSVQFTYPTTESVTTTAPVTTTVPDSKAGDINGDDAVNLKDVVILRRHIAGGWGVKLDENIADINKDGAVNLKDVVLLRRYIAGGWNVTLK